MNSVGDFRHQRFRKSHRPAPLVVFKHRGEREPSRVCRIVIRAVVIYGPVPELEAGVCAVCIVVEKGRQAELSEPDFEPAFVKRGKMRQWRPGGANFPSAEGTDQMRLESGDVWRVA